LIPNQKRAKNAIRWTWIVLIAQIIMFIYTCFDYAFQGKVGNNEEFTGFDLITLLIVPLFLITIIIWYVKFILWFKMAYFNLHQKVQCLSYSVGWTIGCWFVPIMNLFRPYKIMKELFEETEIILERENINTGLIGRWWCVWIAYVALSSFSNNSLFNDLSIIAIIYNILWYTVGIISYWLTIRIIQSYSDIEHFLIEIKDVEKTLEVDLEK
jgi:hypothetical protein